jgi:hypothetical protein
MRRLITEQGWVLLRPVGRCGPGRAIAHLTDDGIDVGDGSSKAASEARVTCSRVTDRALAVAGGVAVIVYQLAFFAAVGRVGVADRRPCHRAGGRRAALC